MNNADILAYWREQTCVLATMHGKERVIAPVLERALGLTVAVPQDFNTDAFGTFTGEIPRAGNQREAARAKAYAAMERTGAQVGIASEGSFGPHPTVPFVQSNLELVLLIDRKHDLEIAGHYRTSAVSGHGRTVVTVDEAVALAKAWGFPEQGVILRASEKSVRNIHKDIETLSELEEVAERLLSRWFGGSLYIETDMRAHRCPPRMESIKCATHDLIEHCLSHCPRCQVPGFVVTEVLIGLPCAECALPTDMPKARAYSCTKCAFHEIREVKDHEVADPSVCAWCNP